MSSLAFLAEPAFVVVWYLVGPVGAARVLHDAYRVNTNVQPALKWAWPIFVFFFAPVGLAFYRWTCRPPGVGRLHGDAAEQRHHEYVSPMFRRVTGSVIHCVGGDGLGIMTVARRAGSGTDASFSTD